MDWAKLERENAEARRELFNARYMKCKVDHIIFDDGEKFDCHLGYSDIVIVEDIQDSRLIEFAWGQHISIPKNDLYKYFENIV